MLKKDIPIQMNLFGISTIPTEPKKTKNMLTSEQKVIQKEKFEAHRAWKLYKSRKYDALLTESDKRLLLKYYGVRL